VGRSPYQSEKRRKELARLKKQEEKRQRRFNKKHEGEKSPDEPGEGTTDASTPLNRGTNETAPTPQEEWETKTPRESEGPGQTT